MVTKETNKAKAPDNNGARPQPKRLISDEDDREKRLQELLRREQALHSQGFVRHASYVPPPPQGVTNTQAAARPKKELDKEEKDELLELLKGKKDKSNEGCPDNDPCKPKKELNMQLLAERVFERLIFEARIERERVGWTV